MTTAKIQDIPISYNACMPLPYSIGVHMKIPWKRTGLFHQLLLHHTKRQWKFSIQPGILPFMNQYISIAAMAADMVPMHMGSNYSYR